MIHASMILTLTVILIFVSEIFHGSVPNHENHEIFSPQKY